MTAEASPTDQETGPAFTIEVADADTVRPLRHKHLRPDQPMDKVKYMSDECVTCRHFAARDSAGVIVGVGSLHFNDRVAGQPPFGVPGMRIRGMAVEDEWRGKGVGAGLIGAMLEVGREAGIVEAWANARTKNRGFYVRNGFSEVSHEFEIPTIGEHVVVALSLK
jgi:GNAT superfamily N-acetyltransferase